jgi:hypothetical protein
MLVCQQQETNMNAFETFSTNPKFADVKTPDLTVALNELRVELGMAPVKAWKESRAKLEAAINKLCANVFAARQADEALKAASDQQKVDVPAPVKAKKLKADAVTDDFVIKGVALKFIMQELGMTDAKVARAKLRRNEVACLEGLQWVFAAKDVAAVKAILTGDRRKK